MIAVDPDGLVEPVAAERTPHETLTRTTPAAASSRQARSAGDRVFVTGVWTVRRGDRFPRPHRRLEAIFRSCRWFRDPDGWASPVCTPVHSGV
jgi:hypothetical protein